MGNKITHAGNLMEIQFESHITPIVKKKSGKNWLNWGDQNNYPEYLIELYKRNAYHGSIIKTKVDHIYGKGLCYDESKLKLSDIAIYENFLNNANQFEDWNSVFRKNCLPFELFDGIALQVVYKFNGKIDGVYNQEFAKFRRSECGKKAIYCEAWLNEDGTINAHADKDPSYKEYPLFNPYNRTETQIIYFKFDTPSSYKYGNIYPDPNYIQICQDIETDIEITNFHFSNMKNGMFAAAMLSLFNGTPDPTEIKKYERLFDRKFKGTGNTGKMMFNFVDKGGQKAELTTLTQSDLDKMFVEVTKRTQQNILTGHRIDPQLASIILDGQTIGDNTIYLQKYDRWMKSYIEHRQEVHLNIIKKLAEVDGIDLSHLEVRQKTPASFDLTSPNLTNYVTVDEVRKYLGLEPLEPAKTLTQGTNPVAKKEGEMQSEVTINENLKKLSGKDWMHIKRMIRDVTNGKVTKEVGAMMLKNAYGLSDEDLNTLFAQNNNFSAFDKHINSEDYVLSLFESCAIDEPEGDVVEEKFIDYKTGSEAFLSEQLTKQKFTRLDDLSKSILDLLKGNPLATGAEISKALGVDEDSVNKTIGILAVKELVDGLLGNITITDKGLNKEVPNAEVETFIVYKYVTRNDVPEAQTSRPFCKKLLAMTRNGKVWTREQLDNLTNTLGEEVWTYRGGFYTNPDTGETTAYCRHIWKSVTKIKKKK